ncbi:ATP-binding protein [Bifidobacterium subtile]|uniref:ATPase n=1 Tax=Bifidobacterium subtile TaxID=77635 RepID=A0A087E806_9BIFI|nr:ATP-binding protein [Bifidobacterium subtile]KFJ03907.1 ATPase [Bifidobacterium subtile]QOL36044.1 ATP-binding protein [Bifidobacterium subtile]
MMLYPRQRYLKRLRPFYDDAGLIKVITGIRRCGKSSLMMSVADELLQRGVDERSIVFLNLDSRELRKVTTPDALDRAIEERIPDSGLVYLFIDKVQNVKGFETVINAYREDGRFSIFITGSNSYLLSGELATKLTGRYIELEMYTLSYGEYLDMRKFIGMPVESGLPSFNDYLTYGGFPKSLEYSDPDAKALYIQDVARQIFEKDITDHSRVTNRDTFERVQSYLINNYASPTNLTRIAQYLQHSEHIAVKRETLARYVRMLENAKILYTCPRFDLRSRKSLRGGEKYYIADPGIYFARNTDTRLSYGPALENALYLHLRAKGYQVSMGRIGGLECDFIVRRRNQYAYIQVSMSILDPQVEEREYRPFAMIRDAYPRYLFTLDQLPLQRDGVRHINLMQFLADDGDIQFD